MKKKKRKRKRKRKRIHGTIKFSESKKSVRRKRGDKTLGRPTQKEEEREQGKERKEKGLKED